MRTKRGIEKKMAQANYQKWCYCNIEVLPVSAYTRLRRGHKQSCQSHDTIRCALLKSKCFFSNDNETEIVEKIVRSFQVAANNKWANKRMKTFTIYINAQQLLRKGKEVVKQNAAMKWTLQCNRCCGSSDATVPVKQNVCRGCRKSVMLCWAASLHKMYH